MAFSVVTIYWGNQKNIDDYLDQCLKYADDIIIIFVDLFDKKIQSDKARIYTIDYDFLINRGLAQAFNLGISYAKNDWVFLLDVGKELTYFNYELVNKLKERSEAGFAYSRENDNGSWVRMINSKKATIVGVMHEEAQTINIVGDQEYPLSHELFATYRYKDHFFNSEFEKNVCDGYRALLRLHWYYKFNHGEITANPQSFINSMRDLNGWWKDIEENFLDNYYKKYEYLYKLNKHDLVAALGEVDEWRKYPI